MPRGFLLVGPPGTGKTLLARAVAGEAGVPFYSAAGSDFSEMFVGVGAARVRDLFAKAKKTGGIVFLDEIDSVGRARNGNAPGGGANDERESTLNALLVEMDGFSKENNVVIVAATNRPDILDPALTRAGRFDRQVTVAPPDRRGRTRLLDLYAKDRSMGPDVDFVALARRTPGLTGADICNLVNQAALEAARGKRGVINSGDFDEALATVVMGRARKSAIVTDRDREVTAWHEAGHTVAALVLPDANDPVQVTIVPRGPAGGVTWMGGDDNSFLTRSQARAQLVVALGGRAAEELLLDGDFTQGASGDLQSATGLATQMVTKWGMSNMGLVAMDTDRIVFGGIGDKVHAEIDVDAQRGAGVGPHAAGRAPGPVRRRGPGAPRRGHRRRRPPQGDLASPGRRRSRTPPSSPSRQVRGTFTTPVPPRGTGVAASHAGSVRADEDRHGGPGPDGREHGRAAAPLRARGRRASTATPISPT